jgi:hypothetical protein
MKFLELSLLWSVNVVASLLVALSILPFIGGPMLLYWLGAWVGSSIFATLWYALRRNHLRWSYLEGVAWGLLAFLVGSSIAIWVLTTNGGRALRRLENLIEIFSLALVLSLPALLLIAPFTVRLWVWVVQRVRRAA